MKITITIPEHIYEKLEDSRGLIPRSTYIQALIAGSVKANKKMEKMYGTSVVDVVEKSSEPKKSPMAREDKLEKLVKDGVVKKGVKQKEWIGPQFKDSKLNKKINNGHNN
jgi:metal-responsive CopG/Arc/MetJ family transcriptional regulator